MADRRSQPPRLIAVEGADSAAVAKTAADLRQTLMARRLNVLVSRWDASALFTDVAAAPVEQRDVSPRTLMLLYAADLAFRLRWEIEPTLDDGQVVVAAPYVLTAIGFGVGAGLPEGWLRTLFNFAPTPSRTLVLREPKGSRVWKRRPERGFGDCCTALLSAGPEGFARRKTRAAMVSALAAAADAHGGPYRKRERRKLIEQILKPGDRQAAPEQTRRRAR